MKRSLLVIFVLVVVSGVYAIDWINISEAVSTRQSAWSADVVETVYSYGPVKTSSVHEYAEEFVKNGRKFDSTSYNVWRSAWLAFTSFFRSGSRFRVR